MGPVIGAILLLAVLFGLAWLYNFVKTQAKRKLFFRGQYEREQALTGHDLALTTAAPMPAVHASLAHHIPDDRSARTAFLGGAMRVKIESPERIVYNYIPKITTGGGGDRFTASVTFHPAEADRVRAVVSIDSWREHDGVTRRAGLAAMEKFRDDVVTAFRAVDPAVQVSGA